MIKFFNKKTVIVILIAAALFSIVPKPASAGILDIAIDAATEVLKNLFYQQITKQAVNWIQGGGNPKFITNLPGFLRDAIDQAGGKFLETAIGPQICSPFRPLLKLNLYPVSTFNDRTSCTMSDIGVNLDAFLKDFRSGGWIAWNQMVLNPQNNVYGAYVMAWDQYEIEKAAVADAAKSEVQTGKGFLDQKKCIQRDDAILDPCNYDCSQTFQNQGAVVACQKSCEESSCTKWETQTPGSIVGDTVADVLATKLNLNANATNPIAFAIGAIVNAAINRLMKEGAGLLSSTLSSTPAQKPLVGGFQQGTTLISSINQSLNYENQLFVAKQTTLNVLNQSVAILVELQKCQASTSPALAYQTAETLTQVQNTVSITTSQITQIQSDITTIQTKKKEIENQPDLSQMPSSWTEFVKDFWPEFADMANPSAIQSLVLAAQSETSKKEEDLSSYQQQLTSCRLLQLKVLTFQLLPSLQQQQQP